MVKKILKFLLRKSRNTLFSSKIEWTCSAILRSIKAEDIFCDPMLNGEYSLIEKLSLSEIGQLNVIDVGSNIGDWSHEWLNIRKDVKIYCFEAARPTYEKLANRFSKNKNVTCHNIGLSHSSKESTISYIPDSDSGSSLNVLPWPQEKIELPIKLEKGDNIINNLSIKNIFFLKIDTEGHEIFVLRGFKDAIKNKSIKCIQFEYGYTYIPNRHFLKDAYDILENNGYSVGQIFPEGVKFKNYDIFKDDDFHMKNYFATCDPNITSLVSI